MGLEDSNAPEGDALQFDTKSRTVESATPHSRDFQRLAMQLQCTGGAIFLFTSLLILAALFGPGGPRGWEWLYLLTPAAVGAGLFAVGTGFANYQGWAWYATVGVLLPICTLNSLVLLGLFVRWGRFPNVLVICQALYVFYVAWVLLSRNGRRRYQETVEAVLRARAAPDSLAGRELLRRDQAARGRRRATLAIVASVAAALGGLFLVYRVQQPRMTDPKSVVARLGSMGRGLVDDLGNVHKISFSSVPSLSDEELEGLEELTVIVELDLSKTQITDATLERVGKLKSLRKLKLDETRISDAGLAHLAGLSKLEELEMDQTAITGQGLAHLKGLPALNKLSLVSTKVSDDGLAALAEIPTLATLELGKTPVTDKGLAHLPRLEKLDTLGLSGTSVTDAGMTHLGSTKKLRKLNVRGTSVTSEGLETMKKARPFCHVSAN